MGLRRHFPPILPDVAEDEMRPAVFLEVPKLVDADFFAPSQNSLWAFATSSAEATCNVKRLAGGSSQSVPS
jgi:hypothetical protein